MILKYTKKACCIEFKDDDIVFIQADLAADAADDTLIHNVVIYQHGTAPLKAKCPMSLDNFSAADNFVEVKDQIEKIYCNWIWDLRSNQIEAQQAFEDLFEEVA